MVNPAAAQQLLQGLAAAGAAESSDVEARVKQSRLTFAATIEAMRSGCTCGPCEKLRRAVDILLQDVEMEGKADAPRVDPPS